LIGSAGGARLASSLPEIFEASRCATATGNNRLLRYPMASSFSGDPSISFLSPDFEYRRW
jgi:hypothetical protein